MSLYSPNESVPDDCFDEQFKELFQNHEVDLNNDSLYNINEVDYIDVDDPTIHTAIVNSTSIKFIPDSYNKRPSSSKSISTIDESSSDSLSAQSSTACKRKRNPLSQNAILAKANREKKKEFVTSLQERIAELERNNSTLSSTNTRLRTSRRTLRNEVVYLKRVLRNDSALSTILTRVDAVEEVSFTTRFSDERKSGVDHTYDRTSSFDNVDNMTGSGVCLHIDGAQASLEFCSHCSKHASQPRLFDSMKDDDDSSDYDATPFVKDSSIRVRKRKY